MRLSDMTRLARTCAALLAAFGVAHFAHPSLAAPLRVPEARIVFTRYSPNADSSGIYSMRPDGSERTRLSPVAGRDPQWAPGHEHVAYLKWSLDGLYLRVMSDDGGDDRLIARVDDFDGYPYAGFEWSPDGSLIAFQVRSPDGLTSDIFVARPDGSEIRSVTAFPGSETQPSWSPDGTRIAFAGIGVTDSDPQGTPSGIFTVAIDGSDLQQLTYHQEDMEPVWSPDGGSVAFSSYRNDCCYNDPGSEGPYSTDMFVVSTDGTDERQLTDDDCHWESGLVWLPDSSGLIYTASDDDDGCMRPKDSEIRFIGLDGSAANLTRNKRFDRSPSLSPNGRWFTYTSSGRKKGDRDAELFIQALFKDTTYRLTNNGPRTHESTPNW